MNLRLRIMPGSRPTVPIRLWKSRRQSGSYRVVARIGMPSAFTSTS